MYQLLKRDITVSTFSLDKTYVLSSRKDFEQYSSNGKKYYFDGCVLIVSKQEITKFGIIASKKICKNSVNRNIFKRWVREFFRNNLKHSSYIFIFICNKHPKNIIYKEMSDKVLQTLTSEGILKKA